MIQIRPITNSKEATPYDFTLLEVAERPYQIILVNGFVDSLVATIYLNNQLVVAMSQWVEQSLSLEPVPEIGGFILGATRMQTENERWEVVMDQFIPAKQVDFATPNRLEFGIGPLEEMDDARQLYPHLELVAWFHTHPGHTPYLSSIDLNTHNSFFGEPHYIAIVLDPLTENWDTGFFTRQKDGTMNNKNDRTSSEWIHWKSLASDLKLVEDNKNGLPSIE